MKTKTKSYIIKLLEKKRQARPVELVKALKISPQSIHRHLKSLVSDGVLESRRLPPSTYYVLAGVPDFSKVIQWLHANKIEENTPSTVCETRDILVARLSHLKALVKQGLANEDLPFVISATGEIGNNSFDHNMGQWRDVAGCWLESQITGGRLWICIADRGQGIYRSLIQVDPTIQNDQAALETAFEKHISGRAPEKRGNGLKYVKSIILEEKNRGLACCSGRGQVHYGDRGVDCQRVLETSSFKANGKANGTITLIYWGLK